MRLQLVTGHRKGFFPTLEFCALPSRQFTCQGRTVTTSVRPSLTTLVVRLTTPCLGRGTRVVSPFYNINAVLVRQSVHIPTHRGCNASVFKRTVSKTQRGTTLTKRRVGFVRESFFSFERSCLFSRVMAGVPIQKGVAQRRLSHLCRGFFQGTLAVLRGRTIVIVCAKRVKFIGGRLHLRERFSLLRRCYVRDGAKYCLFVVKMGEW